MKNTTTRLLISLASTVLCFTGASQGANSFFDIGDLVLYFQKPGNNNTVYVSLGDAATNFRGDAAGPTADRQSLNIINLNQTLTDAFGAGWASDTGIYAGAAAAASSSPGPSTPLGDQTRTVYVSRGRDTVGTVGESNSTPWNLVSVGNLTGPAGSMIGMCNTFEVRGTLQQQVLTVDISTIDNANPFSSPGIQGLAFGGFVGGVQQKGTATEIGTLGPVENIEFALDINRIAPRNASETEGEIDGPRLIGTYEGTLVIATNGDVSFITAIPEPSSIALSGLAALGLAFRRRRNS